MNPDQQSLTFYLKIRSDKSIHTLLKIKESFIYSSRAKSEPWVTKQKDSSTNIEWSKILILATSIQQTYNLQLLLDSSMSEIGLFANQPQKPHSPTLSKSKEKRPPQLSVSKVFSNNHKWKECKIIGKNISIRSYSAACSFQNKLYLYGGYQILHGSLDDFYAISLDQNQPTFIWEEIHAKSNCHPGRRSKHALLGGKNKIYLIGGLKANDEASNQIYEFDPSTHQWKILKPQGPQFPPLESFSAVLINNGAEEKIVIAFGFNETIASPSNTIYEYNISKNKLSILHEGGTSSKHDVPSPRVGSAITTDNQNVYIFGGKDQSNRFNDLWSFSLTDFKFTRLKDQGEIPTVRNGHTITFHEGQLYVFGGIHDITWELDDLHIYSLKTNKWATLEQDSPRKIDKKTHHDQHQDKNANQNNSGKKKNWYETHTNAIHKQNSSTNSPSKNFSLIYNEEAANRNESPGKMLEQQRKKVFYQKKAEMLSNFEISKQQKEKLLSLQTSSQAMKNSLDVIGTPDPRIKAQEDKLTQFGKQTISKFLQPLENNSNIVIGKKPCARDGHCSVIIGEELVIVGGDRHQMSFNDIYKLNLKLAVKEISH